KKARDEAEAGVRNAKQSEQKARKSEEAARQAMRKVEEAYVDGLLRPIGPDDNDPNDFELAALLDLASLPAELRLLFIERALASRVTAGQLSRRMAIAVHAAVGLDRRLRGEARRLAQRRANDASAPQGVRETSRRLAALLEEKPFDRPGRLEGGEEPGE